MFVEDNYGQTPKGNTVRTQWAKCGHIDVDVTSSRRHFYIIAGGGRVVRWCWVNFQCRGVLLIWIIVGQGPTALAVGAGGGCLDIFFSCLSFLFSFSLSLGDGPIKTEILSQRAVKPKTTNQPTTSLPPWELLRWCGICPTGT